MRLTSLFQYQKLFEGAADYQAMIDAFPYGQIIPVKPWPDWTTKDSMSEAVAKVKFRFQTELNWAKAHLKRYDRIIWWLRYIRFSMYYSNVYKPLYNRGFKNEDGEPVTPQWPKYFDPDSNAVKRKENIQHSDLMHFMAIDYHKIQNHVWSNESPDELYELFREYEGEYEKQEVRRLAPDSSHTVVLQMGEYVWLNLNKAGCADEGKAGRHCGNMPRSLTKDRILSLRRATKGKQEVCLTFVMEEDGYLGERKGFANNSPDPKYHPYIIELLKQPFIKGLKGGRWAAANDFQIKDLSPELADSLFKYRPDLFVYKDLQRLFGKDNPAIFEHVLKITNKLIMPDVVELFSFFPDRKYELVDILGARNNKVINIFDDRFSRFHNDRSLVEHMVYNGLVGNTIDAENLKKYGFSVRDPVLGMLIKKVDHINSEIEPPDDWSFLSMYKATPRDSLMEFIMKTKYLPDPFEDYMRRLNPDEMTKLLKSQIITTMSYIQYFGKDSKEAFNAVLGIYKEKHSFTVGKDHIIIDDNYSGYELNRNSTTAELWTGVSKGPAKRDVNIPIWYLENIITDEISDGLLKVQKRFSRNFNSNLSRKRVIEMLNDGESREYHLSSVGDVIMESWRNNLMKPELDLTERYNEFKNETDQAEIALFAKGETDIRLLERYGVPPIIPLKIKVDKWEKKSVIVENEHLVDWYIFKTFFKWNNHIRYVGPIFDIGREEIEAVIDYNADRSFIMKQFSGMW